MANPAYADLEIRILNQAEDGFPVELTLNADQEFGGGRLDPAFLPWIPSADPYADGQRLFDWLFAHDKLKQAWAEARGQHGQRRIRLRIDADAPELHAIPWELLRDGVGQDIAHDLAAANATPFSRYLAGRWQPGSPILTRPIQVLVVIAAPKNLEDDYGLQPINPMLEFDALSKALAGLPVQLTQFPSPGTAFDIPIADDVEPMTISESTAPCTLAGLEAELKQGYHVLHLIAHGAFSKRSGQAQLFLADDDNQVELVSDEDFAEMLARQLADTNTQSDDKLRLVYLSSCQTAARSPADAFRGFAPRLVQAGVPAVLAMQDLVPVDTARAFSTTFYRQLLQHGQVDLAANEARAHLRSAKLPGASIPVLFMRLRDGALLGQRGRIVGEKSESFWPFLIKNIRLGQCIPFMGPRLNAGLLPDSAQIAARLAERYGYPLDSNTDLAKVTRYIALRDPALLRGEYTRMLRRSLFTYLGLKPTREDRQHYKDANLSETMAGINWAERVLTRHENQVHHLLADLNLPLYMTTNVDNFMVEALRYKGRDPRRAGPRWEQMVAGTPQYTLQPEPSRESPVVFHLNGYDEDPEQHAQMVLTEDDYLRHFVRLARDHNTVLPMNIVRRMGESSFLFLGYSLNDWEFRVILQGLVSNLKRANTKLSVGVQLDDNPDLDTDKVLDYLGDYMGRYNIKIYWGTPQQFVSELHSEWQRSGGTGQADEAYDEEWDDDDW